MWFLLFLSIFSCHFVDGLTLENDYFYNDFQESTSIQERQDDLNDQIVPFFVASFLASLVSSFIGMGVSAIDTITIATFTPATTATTTTTTTTTTPAPPSRDCRCGIEGNKRIVGGTEAQVCCLQANLVVKIFI